MKDKLIYSKLVPQKNAKYTLDIKKSQFIGQIFYTIDEKDAKRHIESVKKQYIDARHNVFAYIVDGIERYSDDGEPQGTAGMPILEVLRREKISNVCIIITRYFGGTLLGTGGLVRAYTSCAKSVLDEAGISKLAMFIFFEIEINYAMKAVIESILSKYDAKIEDTIYTDKVFMEISIIETCFDEISEKIFNISNGEYTTKFLKKEFKPLHS